MAEIPLLEFDGTDAGMAWVYESPIGEHIEYGDQGNGAVRWATGQQVRVMHPGRCTRCWNAAPGGDSPGERIGLVSLPDSRDLPKPYIRSGPRRSRFPQR